MSQVVTIKPSPLAGRRTKNRLSNRWIFQLEATGHPECMGGRKCVRVSHSDGWFGWLAEDEIVIRKDEISP
jgi:hypothetical protein